jgi:hypothetical protein
LQDGIHHERALDRDEAAQAGIRALDFLHDEPVFDVAHAGASVTLEIGAEKTERRHFGDEFAGEAGVAESVADQREGALIGEAPGCLPDHEFLRGELRIDQKVVDAAEGHEFQCSAAPA